MLIYYKVDDILFKVKLEFEYGISTVCKKKYFRQHSESHLL